MGKRPLMGRIAHEKADVVVVTNDNCRSENPDLIADDIVRGFAVEVYQQYPEMWDRGCNWLTDIHKCLEQDYVRQGDHPGGHLAWRAPWHEYHGLQNRSRRYVMTERYAAIRCAIGFAQPGDAVIIAGKGHEDYQEFYDPDTQETVLHWFDDRVEAYAALREIAKWQSLGVVTSITPWAFPDKSRISRNGPEDIVPQGLDHMKPPDAP